MKIKLTAVYEKSKLLVLEANKMMKKNNLNWWWQKINIRGYPR